MEQSFSVRSFFFSTREYAVLDSHVAVPRVPFVRAIRLAHAAHQKHRQHSPFLERRISGLAVHDLNVAAVFENTGRSDAKGCAKGARQVGDIRKTSFVGCLRQRYSARGTFNRR